MHYQFSAITTLHLSLIGGMDMEEKELNKSLQSTTLHTATAPNMGFDHPYLSTSSTSSFTSWTSKPSCQHFLGNSHCKRMPVAQVNPICSLLVFLFLFPSIYKTISYLFTSIAWRQTNQHMFLWNSMKSILTIYMLQLAELEKKHLHSSNSPNFLWPSPTACPTIPVTFHHSVVCQLFFSLRA